MRANSLALRLFLSATGWTVVILIVTGIVLSSIYQHTVEVSFDRRLGVYLRTLISDVASPPDVTPAPGATVPSDAASAENADKIPQSLGEPLFDLPLSGWYWQIARLDRPKPEIRASRSLWDRTLAHLDAADVPDDSGAARQGYVQGPEDQRLRIIERTIDLGDDGKYLISVAGDAGEIDDEVNAFNIALLITFGGLSLLLLLLTMFQVRFGLAPLKRISDSLASIRSGTADRLVGEFPDEIAPLARETNALIEANKQIVERARTHVGNLAHALKTPLSVMLNEAEAHAGDPFAAKVHEQSEIMRNQIAHHLERARLAARLTSVGTVTDVPPVVTALARSMEKIHHARRLAIAVDAPRHARFHGERQDLEEMVGNLVDNACKWAQSRIAIEVVPETHGAAKPVVRIVVDDDGRGLSPAEREQVARRGQRLDETKPGSGLGLSIVVELASLYGGSLNLGSAPIGGLRAELVLPASPPQ
jgi:signal transduction histidine kinase